MVYISLGNNAIDDASRKFLNSTFDQTKQYIEPVYFVPHQYEKMISMYDQLQKQGEELC